MDVLLGAKDQVIEQNTAQQYELIEFMTGKNRVQSNPGQLHSMPLRGGIQDKIRRAERLDREEAEPLIVQRKKEYEQRINDLMPETEVVDGKH
jgi:hypothetical protein